MGEMFCTYAGITFTPNSKLCNFITSLEADQKATKSLYKKLSR